MILFLLFVLLALIYMIIVLFFTSLSFSFMICWKEQDCET